MKVVHAYVHNLKTFASTGEVSIDLRVPIEAVGEITSLLFQTGPGRAAFIVPGGPSMGNSTPFGVHSVQDQGPLSVLAGSAEGHEGAETGQNKGQDSPERRPIGPRCLRAVELCRDKRFWAFLKLTTGEAVNSEQTAANLVRAACEITSRRELDEDTTNTAWALFQGELGRPFEKYLATREQPS